MINTSIKVLRAKSDHACPWDETSTRIVNGADDDNHSITENQSVRRLAVEGPPQKQVLFCVLRSYQRICCAAVTQSPRANLYEIREGAERIAALTITHSGELLQSDSTAGVPGQISDISIQNDLKPKGLTFLDSEEGTRQHQLPTVPVVLSMECLRRIDNNLSRLRECLSPSDIMIVVSPCGDYFRYYNEQSYKVSEVCGCFVFS